MGKKSNSIEFINDSTAVLKDVGVVAQISKERKKNTVAPTESKDKDVNEAQEYVDWGENNNFPLEWERDIEKNDTLRDAIEKEIDRIYASGIEYFYEKFDNSSTEKHLVAFYNEDLEEILYSPIGLHSFEQQITDYVKFRVPAPEVIIKNGKAIVSAIPATHLRWGKQDKNGYVSKAFFTRNWEDGASIDDETMKKINVIDPLIDLPSVVRSEGDGNYIYRSPFAGYRTYYDLSPAYTAKTSRWLGISESATATFDYFLKNQISPKFWLEIDVDYMIKTYGSEWEKGNSDTRQALLKKELQHFHKQLVGPSQAGNNLITLKEINQILQKEYSLWTVTPFKTPEFKDGQLKLIDEADKHIRQAVGLDPSMQGRTNSGMGSGSGSDKREAFNIRMATAQRHVDRILSVYYWVIKFNNITGPNGEPIKLRIKTPYLQTLNQVTPEKRVTKTPEVDD